MLFKLFISYDIIVYFKWLEKIQHIGGLNNVMLIIFMMDVFNVEVEQ